MYVEAKELESLYEGSLEQRNDFICEKANEFGYKSAEVVATYKGHSVVVCDDKFLKAVVKKDDVVFEEMDIPVIKDAEFFVSQELKRVVKEAFDGEVSCNRLHKLSKMVDADDIYWLSSIAESIEDVEDNEWYTYYKDNKDDIDSTLSGKIRETKARVPKTRFSKLSVKKLDENIETFNESIKVLSELMLNIVDVDGKLVFDIKSGGFETINKSLIDEAQTIVGLLSKAKKLLLPGVSNKKRMAEAHDKLAERLKTMMVVSEYLKSQAQQINQE